MKLRTLLVLTSLAAPTAAQVCLPTLDLNNQSEPLSSWTSDVGVHLGGLTYFTARSLQYGMEIWRSDGTPAGTTLAIDLVPGANSSAAKSLTVFGDKLLFVADTTGAGHEPWISDGTAAGSQKLASVIPLDIQHPDGKLFVVAGNFAYFQADDGITGPELWRTDGTPAGTQLVKELFVTSIGSYPHALTPTPDGQHLIFTAEALNIGAEPWLTDGTAAGTVLLADIYPNFNHSRARDYRTFGSKMLFVANQSGIGEEPWITDGTEAGTHLLKDVVPGGADSDPEFLNGAELGGTFYFSLRTNETGRELWKTDGTTAGTVLAADLVPGGGSSNPKEFVALGGHLWFVAQVAGKQTLMRIDGVTGAISEFFQTESVSGPLGLMVSGGLMYFRANAAGFGTELWVSDGTLAGTQMVADNSPGPASSSPGSFIPHAASGVIFFGTDTVVGREPWVSDGTAAGTSLLLDVESAIQTAGSSPYALTAIGGKQLYFTANNGVNGNKMYRWTRAGGVEPVGDPTPGQVTDPESYTQAFVGGQAWTFFTARTPEAGRELWKTDGTLAGTQLVADINPGVGSSFPDELLSALGRVFFQAGSPTGGVELWSSDGTAAGTQQVADLWTGFSSLPLHLTQLGEQVLFTAWSDTTDRELFVSDGTAAGTHLLKDIGVGYPSDPRNLTRVGAEVAFSIFRGPSGSGLGNDLWKTDGTTAGTVFVAAIGTANNTGPQGAFAASGDLLYFGARDNTTAGLWVSDLTAAGTQPVFAPPGDEAATQVLPVGDKVFFELAGALHVYDPVNGTLDLNATALPDTFGEVGAMVPFNSGVAFTPRFSTHGQYGNELYVTDGTVAGTSKLCDVTPFYGASTFGQELSSHPEQLTVVDGTLLFVADQQGGFGEELFLSTSTGGYVADLGLSGSGHQLSAGPALLGQPVAVRGANAPMGTSFLGFGPSLALPNGNFVKAGNAAWLNPAAAVLVATTTTPSWSVTLNVPNEIALVGAQFNLQSWTYDGGPTLATSNGLQFVIGQ